MLEVELHEDDVLVGATERLLRLVLLLAFLLLLCILLDGLVVRKDSICLLFAFFITVFLFILINGVLIMIIPSVVLLMIVVFIK